MQPQTNHHQKKKRLKRAILTNTLFQILAHASYQTKWIEIKQAHQKKTVQKVTVLSYTSIQLFHNTCFHSDKTHLCIDLHKKISYKLVKTTKPLKFKTTLFLFFLQSLSMRLSTCFPSQNMKNISKGQTKLLSAHRVTYG